MTVTSFSSLSVGFSWPGEGKAGKNESSELRENFSTPKYAAASLNVSTNGGSSQRLNQTLLLMLNPKSIQNVPFDIKYTRTKHA